MRILTQIALILTITLTFTTGFLYAGKFDYTLPQIDHSGIEKTSQALDPKKENIDDEKTLYQVGEEKEKRELASGDAESPQRNPSSQQEEGLQPMRTENMDYDEAEPNP